MPRYSNFKFFYLKYTVLFSLNILLILQKFDFNQFDTDINP